MMINGGSFSTPASILSPALQQHQQQIPMFIPPPFYATPAASGSPLITTHQHGRQFRQSSSSSSASFLSTVQQPGSSLLLPSSILNYTQTSNNNNGSVAAPPQSTPVKSSLSNVPLQVLRAKVQQPVGNAGEPPRTPLSRTEFLSMFIEALQVSLWYFDSLLLDSNARIERCRIPRSNLPGIRQKQLIK
jgi:hypothetical protein